MADKRKLGANFRFFDSIKIIVLTPKPFFSVQKLGFKNLSNWMFYKSENIWNMLVQRYTKILHITCMIYITYNMKE